MLGHRGCRLGIAYPEITAMQARAILEAACIVKKEGVDVHPEIMIPLVGIKKELEDQAAVVRRVAAEVFAEQGVTVDYLVGTMIEIPRAALTADKIAEVAEFFSFGTNDLTQMTFGVSRDDAGKFLPLYVSRGQGDLAGRPVRDARPGGRRPARGDRHRARPQHPARPQGRHLRRARRRPRERQVLPPRRHGLRELLAVPHPGGAARRGAGGDRGAQRPHAREVGGGAAWPGWAARSRRVLADGRELRVRDARARDARPLARLLDAVAAEPQVTLLMLPGQFGAGVWRRRIADALADPRCLQLSGGPRTASWSATSACAPTRTPARATSPGSACRWRARWRGLGVGGALLEASAAWAAAHAVSKLALGVFPENAARHRLLRTARVRARGAAPRAVRPRRAVS